MASEISVKIGVRTGRCGWRIISWYLATKLLPKWVADKMFRRFVVVIEPVIS